MRRHTSPSALAALVLALAMAAGGCAVSRPDVNLRSASLEGVTTQKMDVTLDLSMDNPNEFALPIDRIDWTLDLFGVDFADGTSRIGRNVPAQGSIDIEVPLAITYRRALDAAGKLLRGEPIRYVIAGDVVFDTPIGALPVSFEDEGSWDNPLEIFGRFHRSLREGLARQAKNAPPTEGATE